MEWFAHLPPSAMIAIVIGTEVAAIIAGIIALYGVFDKKWRERGEEKDKLEDSVRQLYQEQVKEQNTKITQLTDKVSTLQTSYDTVASENSTLKSIFQGRDQETVEYRRRGMQTMELTNKMAEAVEQNGKKTDLLIEQMTKQTQNTTKIAKSIEKIAKKNLRRGIT